MKTKKIETLKNNDLKYFVICQSNLDLGYTIAEANKELCIDEKIAKDLMDTNFYKKGIIKVYQK